MATGDGETPDGGVPDSSEASSGREIEPIDSAESKGFELFLVKPLTSVTAKGSVCMSKIRRGGYVMLTWIGDHSPRHVHVYRDGKLVVKWNLENMSAMRGAASKRVLQLIRRLQAEGVL